jgi:hypothetical protein
LCFVSRIPIVPGTSFQVRKAVGFAEHCSRFEEFVESAMRWFDAGMNQLEVFLTGLTTTDKKCRDSKEE